MNVIRVYLTTLPLIIGLTACGGGGGSSTPDTKPEPPTSPVKKPGLFIKASSTSALGDNLKNGIKNASYITDATQIVTSPTCPNCSPTELDSGSGDFSKSNVQEAGVDEADIVKYDGKILYQLNTPDDVYMPEALPSPGGNTSPYIELWQTDPTTATAISKARIPLPQGHFYQGGMYLKDDHLFVLHETTPEVSIALFTEPYYWQNGESIVQGYDVSDSANPQQHLSIKIEGALLGSRLIDNHLYLITRFSPVIDEVIAYPENKSQINNNQQAVDDTKTEDLLPNITINNNTQALTTASDCYIPNPNYNALPALPSDGSLVNVTSINLNAPETVSNFCISGWINGFYVSRKSVYLTANVSDDSTLIHKIVLSDGTPEYRGSGSVPGYIGTQNPAFLMGEKNDSLMVFSSYWDNDTLVTLDPVDGTSDNNAAINQSIADFGVHRLTTLRESTATIALEQVAQLPNATAPAKIGKDGERFYSARFVGDKAYAVTFDVIDPLYAFDISNPATPRLEGELELPGVSHFLQPLGDNHLLGIGQDMTGDDTAIPNGVKIVLFDVSDIAKPVVVNDFIIGKRGSSSPAEYDHLALSVLPTDEGYRIALPIARHDKLNDNADTANPWYEWSESALFLFSLSTSTGELSLDNKIVAASTAPTFNGPTAQQALYRSRSIIHNDTVYFSLPPNILSDNWK